MQLHGAMAGHQAVAIAAGKYRTSLATADGSVFIWDGENMKGEEPPSIVRVHGIKHASSLSVGENHSLVVASLYVPSYMRKQTVEVTASEEVQGLIDEDGDDMDSDEDSLSSFETKSTKVPCSVPSLKDLCQDVVIESMVETKNVLRVLEIAEAVGADNLRRYCEVTILSHMLSSCPSMT